MATIPEYQQSVTPDRAPGVRSQVDVEPDAFGAGVARALGNVAQATEGAALSLQERANYAEINQRRLDYETKIDLFVQQDIRNRKNGDAVDSVADTQKFIAQTRQDTLYKDANPVVRRILDQDTMRYTRNIQNGVEGYARQQLDGFYLSTAERAQQKAAQSSTAIAENSKSPDPEFQTSEGTQKLNAALNDQMAYHYGENEKAIAAAVKIRGLSGVTADEYALNSRTKFINDTAEGFMTAGNPETAQQYLASHNDPSQLDPTVHKRLSSRLEKQMGDVQGLRSVAELTTLHKNGGPNDGVDYDSALSDAQKLPAGSARDVTIRTLNQQQAEQAKAIRNDEIQGLNNANQARANGEDPASWSYAHMKNDLKMSPQSIKENLDARAKVAAHPPKDPEALTESAFALKAEMRDFDWDNDPDKSKQLDISKRLTQLSIESPKSVASVKEGGSGVAEYWNQVTNPDPKIQGGMHTFLYKSANGKPGGLEASIHKAVEDGAAPGSNWLPWNWGQATPPTKQQIDARASTIFQTVRSAIVKKGLETPDEVTDFLSKNKDYTQMLVNSHLGSWDSNYRAHTGSKSQPDHEYNPADIR